MALHVLVPQLASLSEVLTPKSRGGIDAKNAGSKKKSGVSTIDYGTIPYLSTQKQWRRLPQPLVHTGKRAGQASVEYGTKPHQKQKFQGVIRAYADGSRSSGT